MNLPALPLTARHQAAYIANSRTHIAPTAKASVGDPSHVDVISLTYINGLEPSQGLTWIAPEEPIALTIASIEDGHRRSDLPALAAGLLLLPGLALLASSSGFRVLTHVMPPLLYWAVR